MTHLSQDDLRDRLRNLADQLPDDHALTARVLMAIETARPERPRNRGYFVSWLAAASVVCIAAATYLAIKQSPGGGRAKPPSPVTAAAGNYPRQGRIVDIRQGRSGVPPRYTAAGGMRIAHEGPGQLSFDTSGSSGCVSLPDAVTVESPTLLTVHYSLPHPRGICPANLIMYRVTIATPGLDDSKPVTIKVIIPRPGATDGSTRTSTAILPGTGATVAADQSPIRALLGGSWYLQQVTGFAPNGGTNAPDITMNFAASGPGGSTIVRAADCDSTIAIAAAHTFTFDKPWQRAFPDECTGFSGPLSNWLYEKLLSGRVDWHGENATITLTKPGVGSASFVYIG